MSLETGTLYYGDCLDWMQRWDDESVDLIYLDPPFNSKSNYNVLFSDHGAGTAQYQAFEDIWQWDSKAADRYAMYENAVGRPAHKAIVGLFHFLGPSGMMAYLTYMAERLEQMRRLLKPTGSIYYHCDSNASHYLKMVMDAVFGPQNFRGEIIWKRTTAHNDAHGYGANADTLLFFAKGDSVTWNPQYQPYEKTYLRRFRYKDPDGRLWQDGNLTAKGLTGGGYEYEYKGATSLWRVPLKKMQALDREGRLHFTRTGGIRSKAYLDEMKGRLVQTLWTDIPPINPQAKERLGYPTQKPLALLNRIIRTSSEEGDVVLDPFCGCGTAIEAAKNLNRQWAGIDISSFAIDVIVNQRLKDPSIPAKGIPYDLASAAKLAAEAPFNFESWAVTRIPGFIPNTKQVADGGVDGRATLVYQPENYDSRRALAQVKGGKFTLSGLRDFIGVTDSHKAAVGCFITLEPVETRAAREVVVNMGRVKVSGSLFPRMQIWPISDYFDRRPPTMPLMTDPYSGKPLQMALL